MVTACKITAILIWLGRNLGKYFLFIADLHIVLVKALLVVEGVEVFPKLITHHLMFGTKFTSNLPCLYSLFLAFSWSEEAN